jgi:hypothetical protein
MSNAIVQGSIGAIAEVTGKSIAETFLNADCIVIIDTSGSMSARDSRGGRSRYDIACEELRNLQNSLPGKIAVINFSSKVQFEPSGVPMFLSCGTSMDKALRFVKVADIPGMKFILISDGYPDDPEDTLKVARTFKCHIDTIFIGPEGPDSGRDFLKRLSAVTGGSSIVAAQAVQLEAGVKALLGAG